MKVVTLKQHNPDGNNPRYPGDVYELSESSARTMEMLGYVKLESIASSTVSSVVTGITDDIVKLRKRGRPPKTQATS